MKKLTLSLKITLCFLFISIFVWIGAGSLSLYESKKQLDEFFDTYQLLLARQLATADWTHLKPDSQGTTDRLIRNLLDDGEEDDDALGFAVFNASGKMIFNDGENGRYFPYDENASGFLTQRLDHEKDKWRIIWIKSADGQYTIAVGQELEYREEAALELVTQSIIPWIFGLMLLMVASIWLVDREFRPLRSIAKSIRSREPEDLSPIIENKIPKEIEPLLKSLNSLFNRIENMLKRERSFISDSAHELRSPLTALKVQLEVALLADKDKKARDEALKKLGLGIERANRLTEQLLALSRLETNSYYKNNEEGFIDWKNLIDNAINEHSDQAWAKNISISVDTEEGVPVDKGLTVLWSLSLRNLLDNAIRYSPKNAEIKIKTGTKSFNIINSNTKVDETALPRLGERFFRPPGQEQSGSGLGLSIVKRVAKLHGYDVRLENTDDGFSVLIIKL